VKHKATDVVKHCKTIDERKAELLAEREASDEEELLSAAVPFHNCDNDASDDVKHKVVDVVKHYKN